RGARCQGRRPIYGLGGDAEVDDVAVLDDVVAPLETESPVRAAGGDRAGVDQDLPGHDLGADEVLLEVGVDRRGGLDGVGPARDRPGAALVLARRQEGD